MRDIKDVARYLGLSLLSKGLSVSPLKLQNQLIFLTHAESPWADQRKGLSLFDYSQREISLDSMYNYYKARHDRNHGCHED